MKAQGVALVDQLTRELPGLREVYQENVHSNGDQILPHLIFWDFTQMAISSFIGSRQRDLNWQRFIDILEENYGLGDRYVDELVLVSFLENLPYSNQAGHEIVEHLGPKLRAALEIVRPGPLDK